ncbi:phosphatidylserine decarboxylase proenzyme [Ignatzschineria indica]|uniref:Phosphatidylserine decarboxylase proenzyme n=1 Tax=Ignatzschineria indica TaxID=472583 RepID=A0A2U2APZ1_9GAMM|nr:archaetidylserine decarboxylase [Ignatzschineria indica]PWD85582.1 phosphatidylserine decarboxylase [Ignatzschineria indica]GGZ88279.1 phosphatidylserine decarboxylase proenzyme [Ignatzschineria indica]
MFLNNLSFQRFSSALFRKITRIKTPWFKNLFISQFAKIYKIAWQDYERQSPEQFINFNDFFTRELKAGARPISEAAIVSPADGKIAASGALDKTQFIHAKGHHFTLESLIADPQLAETFKDGSFATIYLSPRDYHRIHMPVDGKLLRTIHIPGKLYSVSLKTAKKIPALFAENERHVSLFETPYGKMIVILVGAINVSSIETVWSGTVTPPYGKLLQYSDYQKEGISLKKGEEMGRFNMGSTAIVITEKGNLMLDPLIKEYQPIKLGEPLFHLQEESF